MEQFSYGSLAISWNGTLQGIAEITFGFLNMEIAETYLWILEYNGFFSFFLENCGNLPLAP
jgi:hypothetical protein